MFRIRSKENKATRKWKGRAIAKPELSTCLQLFTSKVVKLPLPFNIKSLIIIAIVVESSATIEPSHTHSAYVYQQQFSKDKLENEVEKKISGASQRVEFGTRRQNHRAASSTHAVPGQESRKRRRESESPRRGIHRSAFHKPRHHRDGAMHRTPPSAADANDVGASREALRSLFSQDLEPMIEKDRREQEEAQASHPCTAMY